MPNSHIPNPYAWQRRLDAQPEVEGASMKVSLKLLLEMLPTVIRLNRYIKSEKKRGRQPVMDIFNGLKVTPDMGMPLGGLGGGAISRGFRGDFNRWGLQAGMVHYGAVLADQFSLWAQRPGQAPQALVLNPARPKGEMLASWNWALDAEKATYHALFPRAWTVYEEPLPGLRLTCRQISPVIPHNYKESSYPVGAFVWDVENTGSEAVDTALMFTFQNGVGLENDLAGGHANYLIRQERHGSEPGGEIVGVELRYVHRQLKPLGEGQKLEEQEYFEDPLTFAIAAQAAEGLEISYHTRFVTNSSGKDIWDNFALDGRLGNYTHLKPAGAGTAIGAGLAVRLSLQPGEARSLSFALAWDMPLARFGEGTGWYRRYTRYFGRKGQAARALVQEALLHYPEWEEQIEAWQESVLKDPDLPGWYKALLFNETYYLVDGGTIWTAGREGRATPGNVSTQGEALPEPEIGHFAYLESYEYRMYNTYDVHFYSSFALAMLWPELELSLQRDYIHSIGVEHADVHTMWLSGKKAPRKVPGIIPHDLGSPVADPWGQVNAYLAQDVSRWKDLNSKFVLQIYRDYVLTHNQDFLEEAWPAMQQAVESLAAFDRDGDGMIENDGYPDQTYDAWSARGPSAYTGGLWLACLAAMAATAQDLGEAELAASYHQRLEKAQQAYEKLWNGSYYNYDSSLAAGGKGHHNSIMADQLAGQWVARACALPDLVSEEHARLALQKIFDFNVMQFFEGEAGAVNGMRPDGKVDRSSMQSREMWTGTTYALAACMLQHGLAQQAFTTAQGVYLSVFRDFGLFFQTPEAINDEGVYRAVGYMRPAAIWAMQWAWERLKKD